ncbi:MAG: toxin-antitoxin system toxin component [Algoriphagus marincola HL-49]|uniref:Toxin-antitoxin system toxin component n=1 Tax=Algoriphagus marincola HL-49 TaxID=1305737 RepID=A0A0P7YVX4_9BACT|nr:MAG: toxin-antitoxin system toxin component [Algoriphagus marincola HL-49]
MKYQVLIKPEAQGDLEKIFFWYEEKVLGLGDKFIEDFENKLGLIIQAPFSYQIHYKNFRVAFLSIFPVSIHFVVEGYQLIVLGVFPTAGDPQSWL